MNSSDLSLYAVSACGGPVSDLAEAQAGGATFLQLREKDISRTEWLARARAVRAFAKVPFVVNDDVEIAAGSGADGVHVGQGDAPLAEARAALGAGRIVGVSCSSLEEALAAEKGGADYLGVGAVFPTGTKQDATDVPLSALKAITASVNIPVVAIGGISSENVQKLAGSGIAGSAVVSALFGSGNVKARTEAFAARNRAMLAQPPVRSRGFLLDLDGLLLDSIGVWDEIDIVFLKRHNLFSEENLRRIHLCGTIGQAAEMLRRQGSNLSDEQVNGEIQELLTEAYRDRLDLIPGARHFLETIRDSNGKTALLTASPEPLARPALKRLGIESFFNAFFFNADKTVPGTFYRALESIGTGIRDTLVYDDSGWARRTAETAGFETRASIRD